MPDPRPAPIVAILNSSREIVEMLETVLEDGGFAPVGALIAYLKGQPDAIVEFLDGQKVEVVIYDLGMPYEESWSLLQAVRARCADSGRRFLVTMTNRRAIEALAGADGLIPIIDKPFDIDELVAAVRQELCAGKSLEPKAG
jgi:DNA-binding response OmpR family regulator